MPNLSIKQRLSLLAMISSVLAAALVSGAFFAYQLTTFRKSMTEDMTATAELIGSQSRGFLELGGTDSEIAAIWSALRNKPHIESACLYRGTNIAAAPYFRDRNAPRLVPLHPGRTGWKFHFFKGRLSGFEPIQLSEETIGAVYLESNLNALYGEFCIYLGLAVVFTLAASLMACLFSLQLRRAIAWPIAHLAETARKISAQGNYKLRARKDSSDELGGLIDVFNEMLEQIQKRDAQLEKARDELELRVQERTRELRQAQQAVMQQERLKALGQMASGIAHDINNALSPIVGFAGLICLNEPELREKSRRHLRHIQTAGEDIAHIVSRLRDFYRARDEEELLLPFCLNKAVEQVVEMTAPRWRTIPRNHGIVIEIKKQFGEDLPLLVGIESEFREVLTNLIINAVDALPEGGLITIKTLARHSKSAHGQPGRVVVEVGDNGIGMDEETRTRCLEPFFSTKGRRGTGLGLSMVYGVMERHEGNIEIDSEVGKGTTIRLTFPVREPRPVGLLEPLDETKCQPLRVVCIDDDPLQRELLKEMLERDGHVVETAASGETGVTVFRSAIGRGEPPDVVITDLGMPHVDGREVARVIKRGAPETAVILLTGWGEFITDEETELSDFDGILTKPPRLGDFRDAFRRIGRARNRRRQGVEAI